MEVENGPLEDHFPLQTGGFPLPSLFQTVYIVLDVQIMNFQNHVSYGYSNGTTCSLWCLYEHNASCFC